jgi:hypothetical protein
MYECGVAIRVGILHHAHRHRINGLTNINCVNLQHVK